MSAGQRLAILAVAAVVLIGGFVIAQSSGDDDNDTASTPTTQTSTAAADDTATTQSKEQPEASSQPAPPRVETIRIKGGENASGDVPELTFSKGDTVRLRYRSDEAVEAHLHGYDKAVEVPAGGTKTLTFKATADGIFEIENEETGAQLAKLVIEP